MYSKRKSKISIFLLVLFSWCQGMGLPVPPQNQRQPDRASLSLERVLEEDQNSFVSEEDFSRERRGYQNELPQSLEEEGYWAGNGNLQSQPMPKGEEDGGISEELRSRINCQDRNDQVSQIDCQTLLALQATQQRGYGSDEFSLQIDQASQSKERDPSEKIIDGYTADTPLVKEDETWNNYGFRQENTNVDSQRNSAPKIANENDWDRTSDEKGKITGEEIQRYFPNEIRGREVWGKIEDTTVIPGVKDVQERGFKMGFRGKKSRKGKKNKSIKGKKGPGTTSRRNNKGTKWNRKGNKVVKRKKGNRGQKISENEKKKNAENKTETSVDNSEFTSNRRDNWKKWDKGALDSGQTDDIPRIQVNLGEVWKELDDEDKNDGDTEIVQTDNDKSSSGNMDESAEIQDRLENSWENLDNGEVNNEMPITVPVTVSNRRDDWKKWDRGTKNSGKTDEQPEFQDNQKDVRKKWDNEGETGGNIQKPPVSQSSRRDDWKKWVH